MNTINVRTILDFLKRLPCTDILNKPAGDDITIDTFSMTNTLSSWEYTNDKDAYGGYVIAIPDSYIRKEKSTDQKMTVGEIVHRLATMPSWPQILDLDKNRLIGIKLGMKPNSSEKSEDIFHYTSGDISLYMAPRNMDLLPYDWGIIGQEFMSADYFHGSRLADNRCEKIVVLTGVTQKNVCYEDHVINNPEARVRAIEERVSNGAIPLFWLGTNCGTGHLALFMAKDNDVLNTIAGM